MNNPLTYEDLVLIPKGTIFAEGTVLNNPEGVYMTDNRWGDPLYWVAKKGHGYDDWAIYIHWLDSGRDFVITNGDKVSSEWNIKKLVPCTDEVLKLYRR